MHSMHTSAPPPDLRILLTDHLLPHEDHDSQRAQPLIEQLKSATQLINPPIVAPLDEDSFVVLDGANRSYAFAELKYPHILAQVTTYQSGYVMLSTWHHIVSGWDTQSLMAGWDGIGGLDLESGIIEGALARMVTRDGRVWSLMISGTPTLSERNAKLRRAVSVYQRQARLHRTAIHEPHQIWPLYPDAIALVSFPEYTPEDILQAARHHAYLPPGVSRHVIHGRALRVNYPFEALLDTRASLSEKNETLQLWLQQKMANRQVRYYAEATYQFDE